VEKKTNYLILNPVLEARSKIYLSFARKLAQPSRNPPTSLHYTPVLSPVILSTLLIAETILFARQAPLERHGILTQRQVSSVFAWQANYLHEDVSLRKEQDGAEETRATVCTMTRFPPFAL
jgi:hypothetical protein